jgi:hypothetical protein
MAKVVKKPAQSAAKKKTTKKSPKKKAPKEQKRIKLSIEIIKDYNEYSLCFIDGRGMRIPLYDGYFRSFDQAKNFAIALTKAEIFVMEAVRKNIELPSAE